LRPFAGRATFDIKPPFGYVTGDSAVVSALHRSHCDRAAMCQVSARLWLDEGDMQRRSFVTLVGGALMLWRHPLPAQTGQTLPRIGFLRPAPAPERALDAFRSVLGEQGFVLGRNYELVLRWGDGNPDHLPNLAAELLKSRIDVIVVDSLVATRAVHAATASIPIVMAGGADPVRAGIAKSLSRPGGNVTGITGQTADLVGKTFELLSQIVPRLARVAVIDAKSGQEIFAAADAEAARALGLRITYIDPSAPGAIDTTLRKALTEGVQGAVVRSGPFSSGTQRRTLVEAVATLKLPAVYLGSDFVGAGALISFGPDKTDAYRRAADLVAKILRGAKPGDLPVEQPIKFELIVNLKTARALGLTISPLLLARADEVIE
jgi:ABC-type uncharacterized transport system substrate-binding protein